EVAAMGPVVNKRCRKRGNKGAGANASPKVLRKDYAASRPAQSTHGEKSIVLIGLDAGSTFSIDARWYLRGQALPNCKPLDSSQDESNSGAYDFRAKQEKICIYQEMTARLLKVEEFGEASDLFSYSDVYQLLLNYDVCALFLFIAVELTVKVNSTGQKGNDNRVNGKEDAFRRMRNGNKNAAKMGDENHSDTEKEVKEEEAIDKQEVALP
nr:hypothetical protein [Tanacetum cinerariifolium]